MKTGTCALARTSCARASNSSGGFFDVASKRAELSKLEARASEKSPNRGTIYSEHEVLNQDDVVVMRFRSYGHFARRPTEPGFRAAEPGSSL